MPQRRRTQERRVLPGKRIFRRRLFGPKRGPARGRPDRRIAASAAPPPPRGLRPPGMSPQTQKTPGGRGWVSGSSPHHPHLAPCGAAWAPPGPGVRKHRFCTTSPALSAVAGPAGAACAKLDSHSSHHGVKKNFSSNGPVSATNGRFSGFHGTFFRVAKVKKSKSPKIKKRSLFGIVSKIVSKFDWKVPHTNKVQKL